MTTENSTKQALAQLAYASVLMESATAALARVQLAPGHAAYFAWLAEQAAQRVTRAEIHAADALRSTGAHLLDEPSYQAIADAGLQPSEEDLDKTRGQLTAGRSYYKDTASMIKEWLNQPIGAAKGRLAHADSLIAQVSDAGQRLGPRYPQLAEEFQRPETEPGLLLSAATQLRKAEPELSSSPDADRARAELESDAIALIRHEPATARKHMSRMIEQEAAERRPLSALLAEVGLYRSGMRRGLVHYRLSMLPQDAELIESMCAQIDNPKTIAGNREQLARLVADRYLAGSPPEADGAHSVALPPQEWGDPASMPDWALPEPIPGEPGQPKAESGAAKGQEPLERLPENTTSPASQGSICDDSQDARDPADPVDSVDPVDPVGPVDAGEPGDPDEPLDRGDPWDPEEAGPSPRVDAQENEQQNDPVVSPEPEHGSGSHRPATADPPGSTGEHRGPGERPAGVSAPSLPAELSLPFEELRPEFRHLAALLGILTSGGSADGKQTGVVQPQITVILDYDKMISQGKNFAVTENGLPISAGAARTMMCNAGILPVVLGGKGRILDIGQESRFFPKHMRKALQARYRGCAYPGCSMPASRCEADHITPWEEGGATSVDNGCLFCPMHHHARHCGLFQVIVNEDGLPMVLLPKNLDPHQRPRLNTYWYSPSEAIEAARDADAEASAA